VSRQLSALSAAATEAVRKVLSDSGQLPMSTRQVEEATGYGARYGQLTYRMLCRLAARGEAEKITVPDRLGVYWRLTPAETAAPAPGPAGRRPGPRPASCATRTVTVRIYGRAQIETFEAMCALAGRAPHELAYDFVLERIRDGQADHETQHLAALARAVTLIYGGPRSAAGRREMCCLLDHPAEGDDGDDHQPAGRQLDYPQFLAGRL
jgi:hypothetical protein